MKRLLGGVILAAIVIVWFLGPGNGTGGLRGSVTSRAPDGRRALRALLDELGVPTERWVSPPGELTGDTGLLWLPCAPEPYTRTTGPPVGDLHAARHYRDFLLDGGTLMLPAHGAEDFLVRELELYAFDGLERAKVRVNDDRAGVIGGPLLAIELDGESAYDPDELPEDLVGRVALAGGDLLVVEGAVGHGRVFVFGANRAWLDNEHLARGDHAALALQLLHEVRRGGAVAFDEYALGQWTPPGALALVLGPRLILLFVALLGWLLVALWRRAWVGPFPVETEAIEALSPVTRARARAGLLERARRHDLAGAALVRGVLARLARRHHLQHLAADPGASLDALAALARADDQRERWHHDLFTRPVRGAADLERVAALLDEVEDALAVPTPSP